MIQYLVKRLIIIIPTLIVVSILVFLVVRLMPGDPASAMAGIDAGTEQIEAIRARLGLDKPLNIQYWIWFKQMICGDFGNSIQNDFPVMTLLEAKFPVTIALTVGGMTGGVVIALLLGITSTVSRSRMVKLACSIYFAVAYAIPSFWLSIMLILVFSTYLHWLPPSGYISFLEDFPRATLFLLLPWISIAVKQGSIIGRYVQSSLSEEMLKPYVTTVRAKGVLERSVIFKHALRNALIPVLTIVGLQVGFFLAGAIITETIFNLPGIGRLLLHSLFMRDYPVLQVLILFTGTFFVIINLAVDLMYGLADPRIRYV